MLRGKEIGKIIYKSTRICLLLSAYNDPVLSNSSSDLVTNSVPVRKIKDSSVSYFCAGISTTKKKNPVFIHDPPYFYICCGANTNGSSGKKGKKQQKKTRQPSQWQLLPEPHLRLKITPAVKSTHVA